MSAQEHHRKDEEPKPAHAPPKDEQEQKTQPAEAAKQGLKYVFKIAPADPKSNTIDFEDVADK
jgi:hypothetical protein